MMMGKGKGAKMAKFEMAQAVLLMAKKLTETVKL